MWDENSGWKWELFAEFLPSEVTQTIASYEVRQGEENNDTLFWALSPSGKFTVKSAIQLIRNEIQEEEGSFWKIPWKVWAPQRIRFFLWLVLHDRIMSNVNRVRRGFIEDPCCLSCRELEENTLHLLRDCVEARKIWQLFNSSLPSYFYQEMSLKQWMLLNLTGPKTAPLDTWPTTFAIVIWWIWRWRNSRCFGRAEDIPGSIFTFLMQRIWEVRNARESTDLLADLNNHRYHEVFVRWIAPPDGWVVLNIDGASKGNPGVAGAGGIFRDSAGNMLLAFAEKLGTTTVTRAELMALKRGLVLAKKRSFPRLIIQTDSQVMVNLLDARDELPAAHYHLTQICKCFLNAHPWNIEIHHIYREANGCADWLANVGVAQMQQLKLWEPDEAPVQLFRLMQQDTGGVSWPRLVPLYST